MQEIELKILNIDKQKTVERLGKMGAEFVEQVKIHDKQFDFPDGRIKQADELLRLRLIGDRGEIAYKDKRRSEDGFKIVEETETHIQDVAAMEKILRKLGLDSKYDREKIRISFKKGNVKFEIDQYPKIPTYIEMEGPKEEITPAVEWLGYAMSDTTDMTATQVLKSYGVDPSSLHFEETM